MPKVAALTLLTLVTLFAFTPPARAFSIPRIRIHYYVRPTPTPTRVPTPTPTHIPTPTPTVAPQINPVDVSAYLLNQVNEYRKSQGLSEVQSDSYTCDFAAVRAREISTDFSHVGFDSRVSSHTLPYPSYHRITENIAMTSDYKRVVSMWINSTGHAANMRADTPYVCVKSFGNYYAYEGWKQ